MSPTRGQPVVERGDVLHAAGRQPAELDGEQHDQHQSDPEQRRGIGDERDNGNQVVAPAAAPARAASRPSRMPRPTESTSVVPISSKRRAQPLEDEIGSTGHRIAERVAEVERQDVLHVERELDGERLGRGRTAGAAARRIRRRRRPLRRQARSAASPGASCRSRKFSVTMRRIAGRPRRAAARYSGRDRAQRSWRLAGPASPGGRIANVRCRRPAGR